MKVNITGKGIIPGVNTIPPAYNIEIEETQIRRLLNFNNIRVYEATSGCLITKKNIKTVLTASTSMVDTVLNVNNDTDVKVEDKPVESNKVVDVEYTSDVEVSTDTNDTIDDIEEKSDEHMEDIVIESTDELVDEVDTVVETSVVADEKDTYTETVVPSYHSNNTKKNKNKKYRNK